MLLTVFLTKFSPPPGSALGSIAGGTAQPPISPGALLEKITILQMKVRQLRGEPREKVNREPTMLATMPSTPSLRLDPALIADLETTNQALCPIEDGIDEQEHHRDSGEAFISLSQAVHQQNDRRASARKGIHSHCRARPGLLGFLG